MKWGNIFRNKTKQFLFKKQLKIQNPHQSDLSKRERKKEGIIKAFLANYA